MDDPEKLNRMFNEDKITALSRTGRLSVVVIDSGLGGLSIYALIAEGLRNCSLFNEITLTYFNAWPESHRGYNNMPDAAERVCVFNRALAGALGYQPDIILIACNTLSVLYPQTELSRSADIPVIGIVPFGVDLIYEKMRSHPDSQTIIFGTLTTIAADAHRQALLEKSVDRRRLTSQACDQLAGAIESDPHSVKVRQMISLCVDQAADRMRPGQGAVFAALCCTHYGYSAEYFQQTLEQHPVVRTGGRTVVVIDPNQAMADFFWVQFMEVGLKTSVREETSGEFPRMNLQVVSRITWNDDTINIMARTIAPVSAPVAQALYRYHHNPELF
jgi:glutamate racemase